MTRRAGGAEYIAGWKTADHWRMMKGLLQGQKAPWKKAFEDYFVTRLTLRCINPIKILQDHGTFQGEGFSIVAIQCTLIEFLAAARAGKGYRLRCGLLHEARTKDGWTIWAKGDGIIDADQKIVHRDNMQSAIEAYVDKYGEDLQTDAALQAAFVRKFDALAG